MTGPATAVCTFLADMTRWKTSCCGIEPIIIVMAEDIQKSHPVAVGSGSALKRSRS